MTQPVDVNSVEIFTTTWGDLLLVALCFLGALLAYTAMHASTKAARLLSGLGAFLTFAFAVTLMAA